VVVNYRTSEDAAHDVVEKIETEGGDAIAVQADIAAEDRVEAMAEVVAETYGSIDVLVNNAGVNVDRKFSNMTRDDWERVVDTNLGGVFNCTKTFYDDVRASENGRVINISSVVGQQGNYGQANYAATKSGLFGFTRTIALELASTNSTANCVAPGFVRTDMLDGVPDRVKEQILERVPLGRFAEVEDITGIVRFLASEESSYMTGQVLAVNGGMEW